MLPYYNLYSNGERITARPLSFSELQKIKGHDKITIMRGKRPYTYETRNVNVVKVYIV